MSLSDFRVIPWPQQELHGSSQELQSQGCFTCRSTNAILLVATNNYSVSKLTSLVAHKGDMWFGYKTTRFEDQQDHISTNL